jgi:dienelactone hydrolase
MAGLCVWLWYPAAGRRDAARAPYRPGFGDRLPGFAAPRNAVIRTHSIADASLSDLRTHYPVLVFEPGLGADAAAYTALAEELASQGYVVAAINPTYSTTVRFADGTVVSSVDRARDRADPGQIVNVWAEDLRFVTTRLADLNRSATKFQGRLDLSRVGFVGHSLGGAAAIEAGHDDSRCVAVANLDGDPFGAVLERGLGKPFLFIGHEGALAELPDTAAKLRRVTRTVPANQAFVLSLQGTGHFNFADRSLMAGRLGLGRLLGFLGPIDGRRGITLTRTILTRFFDAFLRDGVAFSPQEIVREYSEVTLDPLGLSQTAP